jgi:hypothetical protein
VHYGLDSMSLPQGTHTVTYAAAQDDCGNTATCSFRLTVTRLHTAGGEPATRQQRLAVGVDDPFDCYGPAGPNGAPNALVPAISPV